MRDSPWNRTLDRRSFVVGLGCLGTGLRGPRVLLERGARTSEGAQRSLVVLQLSGGNDGLSTVVPYADDAYHAARPTLRLGVEDGLRLDDYRAFHSALERLHQRFQEGKLAVVEGVGYPHPNRSHFKSMEIWHTADPRGRAAGDGWIGRTCAAAFGADVEPHRLVHVGPNAPYSVHSSEHPAATFSVPEAYRWLQEGQELARIEAGEREAGAGSSLAFLRERMRDVRDSSASIRAAVARYRTPVEYPRGAFGESLRIAAALLAGEVGTRVVSLELGGFDTHNDQRNRHEACLRTLDEGLGAFLDDLERSEAGRAALVLVFSEFGRRVDENGSRGTDHGCAGPAFLAGASVLGGVYGEHPSLVDLGEGDLVHTTDFRSVYATAIEATFPVEHSTVLGARFPLLACAAALKRR